MSMVVAHVQKFKKADVHGMEVHNKRSTERSKNNDIDREKTDLNYDLAEQQREENFLISCSRRNRRSFFRPPRILLKVNLDPKIPSPLLSIWTKKRRTCISNSCRSERTERCELKMW